MCVCVCLCVCFSYGGGEDRNDMGYVFMCVCNIYIYIYIILYDYGEDRNVMMYVFLYVYGCVSCMTMTEIGTLWGTSCNNSACYCCGDAVAWTRVCVCVYTYAHTRTRAMHAQCAIETHVARHAHTNHTDIHTNTDCLQTRH